MPRLCLLLLSAACAAGDLDALWNEARPELSEQRLRAEVRRASEAGETDTASEALTQLARAQGVLGRPADGHALLDEVRTALPRLAPAISVRYVLERGRLWHAAGQTRRAWRWFRAAQLLASRQQLDYFNIDAMHMLALVDGGSTAMDWNRRALSLAENSQDPRVRRWLGALYNNLGWVYYEQQDYPRALGYLQKAQAWQEANQQGKPVLVARWGVAKLQRLSNQPDVALPVQLALMQAWQALGEEDPYVYEEIGENLLALNEGERARPYFGRALALLENDPWVRQHEAAKLQRLRQLAPR